jgi:putative DNA primase/helicase
VDVDALELPVKSDAVDWLAAHPTATAADILSLPMLDQLDVLDSAHQSNSGADFAVTIDKLARVSKFDYFNQRVDSARSLGIGLTQLDALVKERQAEIAATETQEMFQTIIPWSEPVNGQELLNEIEQLINNIMVFPSEHEAKAIALFVLHTYFIEAIDCAPILLVCSPEKRCGKTTLLTILQKLVSKPLPASNISSAAIYRSIDKWSPTLIIDEADSFMRDNEEIRGVINSGHTRSNAFVIRCVGQSHEPKPFNTFCPKIIAGIGHQADTIEDRAIVIQLKRKLTSDNNKKIRDIGHAKFEELVRKAIRFAQDFIESIQDIRPSIPNSLNDRAADNWAALFAIATIAGNEWLDCASLAATNLSESSECTISIEIELLQDIKTIFEEANTECLESAKLVEKLCEDLDSPWATYNRGKPITARQIAKKLKGFGIKSKDRKFGFKTLKGYSIEDFRDTFERYLFSILPDNEPISATPQQGNQDAVYKEFHMRNNADRLREVTPIKPKPGVDCSAVADEIEAEEKQSTDEMRRIVL